MTLDLLNASHSERSRGTILGLIVLAALSLFVTTASNRSSAALLGLIQPSWSQWGEACIPSLIVITAIYLAIRPEKPFALPHASTPWEKLLLSCGIWIAVWLLGSLGYSMLRGGWHPYLTGVAPVIGFLILGPLGEELLFRGAIYELTERVFPRTERLPAYFSAVLFSAHHLQLHDFTFSTGALIQLAYTLPMGLVLANLRKISGSIWPGFVLHMLTNFPHVFKLF